MPPSTPEDARLPVADPLLEHRIQRLEDSIAQLQDLRQLEDRVTERLSRRLAPTALAGSIIESAGRMIEAPRPLTAPPAPISTAPAPSVHADSAFSLGRPLLVLEMLAEARAIVRMFFDPRYSLSWYARLVPLVLLAAILTSLFWIPGIHLMPEWLAVIVSKFVDLLLAYFLFKILFREARRYRETAPDLPPSLRL